MDYLDELETDYFDMHESAAKIHDGWSIEEIVDYYLEAPTEQIKKAISDFEYAGKSKVCSALKKLL